MSKRSACVVTGSRADYGLLYPLMCRLQSDSVFDLKIVATGMHLSPEFGLTYKVIEDDGLQVNAKVEMLLSSDTPLGTAKSLGLGVIGIADALDRLAPDLVILLGDRYEILAAAQAAMLLRIPIAHICGGDSTEGAIDEAIRHSITKMAQLHFVTNGQAAQRIIQMGEDAARVFCVGSPGLDAIRLFPILSREEFETRLGFRFREQNLLVTFHPVTLAADLGAGEFEELVTALVNLGDQFGILFTKPNADASSRALTERLDSFIQSHSNASAFTSLGQRGYYSALTYVDAIVGNSSSGLYEAPSFHKPTVDIGERQRGRLAASSVIHCEPKAEAISDGIRRAMTMDCSSTVNPYGDGHSVDRILSVLHDLPDRRELLQKCFVMGSIA